MSDVGSSRSYGSYDRSQRAPSVARSTYSSYSRESSPVRSTSRASRYDYGSSKDRKYGGGGLDFGTSYNPRPKPVTDSGSSYSSSRAKASDYNLTPFSRTRTSSMSDARSYDRQPSVDRTAVRVSVDRSIRASVDRQLPSSTYSRQTSYTKDSGYSSKPPVASTVRKPRKEESDESSESVSESEEKRDQNYRYLVSRGTEPMDTEKERERDIRRSFRKEKKSISRTKIKRYPKKPLKMRWNKPQTTDAAQQVKVEELERHSKKNKRESRLSSSGSSKKYGGGGLAFGTSYAPKFPGKSSQSSFSPPARQSSYSGYASQQDEPTSPKPQHSSQNAEDSRSPRISSQKEVDTPKQSSFLSRVARPKSAASYQDDASPSPKPKQSSFTPKWGQQRRNREPELTTDDDVEVSNLTPENLSLKDSIDKVRTWKRQLSQNPPEMLSSPEVLDLPQPKNKPRVPSVKAVSAKFQKSVSVDSDNVFDDDSDDEVNKDFRMSELNKKKQQRLNAPKNKFGWSPKSPKAPGGPRKLCAGVPNFPTQDDSDSDEPFQLHVQGQKKAVKNRHEKNEDRPTSPYDNVQGKPPSHLRPQMDRLDRSPSPYDNMAPKPKPEGRRRGPRLVKNKQKNYADESSDDGGKMNRTNSPASVSSMDTHTGSLQRRKLQKAQSMDSLTTNSSLPDIVPEGKHVFISKVQDIDSLLGFSDDDDEFLSDSDEEVQEQNRRNQARKRVDMINKNMISPPKPTPKATPKPTPKQTPKQTPKPTPKPVAAQPKASTIPKRKIVRNDTGKGPTYLKESNKGKDGYIGGWRDVDDLLGIKEGKVSVLGAGGRAGGGGGQKLTLHIPQSNQTDAPQMLAGSSESLLDTPVPDTPDLPLAPLPAFAYNSPPSSAVSMDNLNNTAFGFNAAAAQKLTQQQRAQQTKSVGNLDQLGAGSPTSPLVDVPTANLIDIRFSPEPTNASKNKAYPKKYSAMAIEEMRAILKNHGKVTTKDLLMVCRKNQPVKPPWVEDEEDRRFTGYKSIREMLEDQNIDVKKVRMVGWGWSQ